MSHVELQVPRITTAFWMRWMSFTTPTRLEIAETELQGRPVGQGATSASNPPSSHGTMFPS